MTQDQINTARNNSAVAARFPRANMPHFDALRCFDASMLDKIKPSPKRIMTSAFRDDYPPLPLISHENVKKIGDPQSQGDRDAKIELPGGNLWQFQGKSRTLSAILLYQDS